MAPTVQALCSCRDMHLLRFSSELYMQENVELLAPAILHRQTLHDSHELANHSDTSVEQSRLVGAGCARKKHLHMK